jgi:hypothetical protein
MIYVNGRFLLQSLTGVNRFAYELCRAWVQMGIPFILCCPSGSIKGCYDVSHFNIVVYGWGNLMSGSSCCYLYGSAGLREKKC